MMFYHMVRKINYFIFIYFYLSKADVIRQRSKNFQYVIFYFASKLINSASGITMTPLFFVTTMPSDLAVSLLVKLDHVSVAVLLRWVEGVEAPRVGSQLFHGSGPGTHS
jgi:hypothetical protein